MCGVHVVLKQGRVNVWPTHIHTSNTQMWVLNTHMWVRGGWVRGGWVRGGFGRECGSGWGGGVGFRVGWEWR